MGESGKMLSWQPKSSDVSLCALEKQTSASKTFRRLNYILANATPSPVLFIKVESKNSVENFQHLACLLVVRIEGSWKNHPNLDIKEYYGIFQGDVWKLPIVKRHTIKIFFWGNIHLHKLIKNSHFSFCAYQFIEPSH